MRVVIKTADRNTEFGVDVWRIVVDHVHDPDETDHLTHAQGTTSECTIIIPADTLEWRAAEYGLTDLHTIWDLVISEFYMTPEDYKDEPWLYGHPDREVSKKAHLDRVVRVKLRHRIATRNGDVHDRVKQNSPMNSEILKIKSEHVRLAHQAEMDRLSKQHEANRLEHLRNTLRKEVPSVNANLSTENDQTGRE